MKLLSILIPSFNRSENLVANVELLSGFIENLSINEKVEIIVSDNCSTDNSAEEIERLIEKHKTVSIHLIRQKENVGLERNALEVLAASQASFVMFLGDDDYLKEGYLDKVVRALENTSDISCIIPAFMNTTPDGKELNGRDINKKSKLYSKGKLNAARLACKGHQLSGLVFLRGGTLEAYCAEEKLRNIYPFMFFLGFNSLRGKTLHLTSPYVRVTTVPQTKKDWSYGNDGLFSERIKNAAALFPENVLFRWLCELFIVINMTFTYPIYLKTRETKKSFIKNVFSCEDATFIAKVFNLILFAIYPLAHKIKKTIKP